MRKLLFLLFVVLSSAAMSAPVWNKPVTIVQPNGDTLQLGPFQGPVACYTIKRGRGVCGTAWDQNRTLVVPDVEQFPGHIACSSLSRSEIVVPLHDDRQDVAGVLDIDSKQLAAFDDVDAHWLEQIARVISRHAFSVR